MDKDNGGEDYMWKVGVDRVEESNGGKWGQLELDSNKKEKYNI